MLILNTARGTVASRVARNPNSNPVTCLVGMKFQVKCGRRLVYLDAGPTVRSDLGARTIFSIKFKRPSTSGLAESCSSVIS